MRAHYRGLAEVYRCLHDLPHDVVLYGLGVQPGAEKPSVRYGGSYYSGHVPQARKGAHCIAPECLSAPSATLVITTCDTVKESQPAIAGRLRPRRALASCWRTAGCCQSAAECPNRTEATSRGAALRYTEKGAVLLRLPSCKRASRSPALHPRISQKISSSVLFSTALLV